MENNCILEQQKTVIVDQNRFELRVLQIKTFFYDVILLWLILFIFNLLPFYANYLSQPYFGLSAREILIFLGFSHLFFLWPLYLKNTTPSSYGMVLWSVLGRLSVGAKNMLFSNPPNYTDTKENGYFITQEEKIKLLALLVKIIFVPLIIVFTMSNFQNVVDILFPLTSKKLDWSMLSLQFFNDTWFILILRIMFLVDTLCFLVGYITELDILDNKIKSVESTWFGWIVALMCYPPFNSVTGQYLPGYSNDLVYFWNDHLTAIMRIFMLVLFGIYTWASLALGTKASNLTNRGIVSFGPYKYIRHPAYIGKTVMWFLTILPIASFTVVFSTLGVMGLYFLRAITEERHLMSDPDYVEYCKKVKYRFIPYIV